MLEIKTGIIWVFGKYFTGEQRDIILRNDCVLIYMNNGYDLSIMRLSTHEGMINDRIYNGIAKRWRKRDGLQRIHS